MADNNDVDIRIAALTDKSSFAEAAKASISLADTIDRSVSEIDQGTRSSKLLASAYRDLANGAEVYSQSLREIIASQEKVTASTPKQGIGEVPSGGAKGLGNASAAKGAIRGLLGGSPIAEAADTLGDLGEVAGSLVQSAGGGAQALASLGVAGLAVGAAVAAAAFVMGEYNKQAEAQARILGSAIDAQRELNTAIADGLTTEQATQQLASTNDELTRQQDLLAKLETEYKNLEERTGLLSFAAKQLDATEEQLSTKLNIQRQVVSDLTGDSQALSAAMNNGSLAANDAAEAERQLASERTQGVLSAAAAAGELEATRQAASDKSKESIQASIKAEKDRQAQLNVELQSLKASGEANETVAAKIKQLEDQLELSAGKVQIYTKALSGAQTEAQISNQKAATKAREAAVQVDKLGSSISSLGSQAKTTSPKLGFKLPDSSKAKAAIDKGISELNKLQLDYQNSLIGAANSLGESLDKIRLNLSRSLEDVGINTSRSIEDALGEGKFLSIRNIQRDAARQREDVERQSNRDRLDAQREGALEILRIEQELARDRARIASGGRTSASSGGFGQIAALTPR